MIAQAISGNKMICPTNPTSTGFGRCAISLKSCGLSVSPKSNISNVSIGRTINIAFIRILLVLIQNDQGTNDAGDPTQKGEDEDDQERTATAIHYRQGRENNS